MIKIIEKLTLSKTYDQEKNEDAYFISDNYIAVIDGATSKNSITANQKTGGQMIKDSIISTLNSLDGTEKCEQVISLIHNNIIKSLPKEKFGYVAASVVIYSIKQREVWLVGDCQLMINSKPIIKTKEVDRLLSELRSLAISLLCEEGYNYEDLIENDVAREMILPFLKKQKNMENKKCKYGYFCFNNVQLKDVEYIDMVEIFSVDEDSEIVFASDGYPLLKETLSESERELENILKQDPLCYKIHPSTKGLTKGNRSYDDRTYVRFLI